MTSTLGNLQQLLDDHGIEQTDEMPWFALSLRLADEYVPGFRPPKSPGRKNSRWNVFALLYLNWRVDELRSKHPHWSIMEVCRKLVKDPALHDSNGVPPAARTLSNKYHDSTKDEAVQWVNAQTHLRDLSPLASILIAHQKK